MIMITISMIITTNIKIILIIVILRVFSFHGWLLQ